ncbi:hypothetical protein BJ170DRAFT_599147 [Xylariales sp. AK1849]|nr:hypothetical protein BJ170DRAFT_599147 [Xylariales sp. AK1849]
MGKRKSGDDATDQQASDALSLHTNPDNSPAYHDDDAPELDVDGILDDDLPPVYSDALASSSSSAPLLPVPAAPAPTQYSNFLKDAITGAEFYIDRRLESPKELDKHIRHLAATPPRPYITIKGTHSASRKKSDGKTENITVTDFDVSVEITPYLFSNAQYRKSWTQLRTVDNGEKVRRGTIFKTRAPGSQQSIEVGGDPKPNLEEWSHLYCASHAGLKSFTLRRQMTGFDFPKVKQQLQNLVRNTNYRGRLSIDLATKDETVEFYNESSTNRWRLAAWIRLLCTFTLLFLFTWPYLWLRTKRWEVVVAEWPFSRMAEGNDREYVSISEDQWYNMWGMAIAKAVLEKRQTTLDQSDLRRAQEPESSFESGHATVDGAMGFFRAGMSAMNEVNRQLGWGGDC